MPKPDRMLRILQLLSHRRVVSLDTIRSSCRIPERTAYRYLNALADANIPVHFDKVRGGYTLAAPVGVQLDDMTLHEIVLLVSALRLVQQQVNMDYREEFDSLITRVISRQQYSLEAFVADAASSMQLPPDGPDLSEEISFALVQAAIAEGRKLTIRMERPGNNNQTEVTIDEPRLLFDGGWGVTSLGQEKGTAARLKKIAKIRIE